MFESKENKGKSNGYAPLNNVAKISNNYLNVVDSFKTISSSSSVIIDISGGSINNQITLTESTTTLNLINVRNGDYGVIILTQGSGGSKTITLGTLNNSSITHKVINNGNGQITLSTEENSVDIISFVYSGNILFWTVGLKYT